MTIRKIVSIFLLITLVGRFSIAEEKTTDFTVVQAGVPAPFFGYLFTPAAIAKIYSITEEEKKKLELECTSDIASLNLELQRNTELKNSDIAAKNKLIVDLTNLKNEELNNRDRIIKDLQEERTANKFYIAGSFIAGILLTGTIVYFTTSMIK